MGGYLSLFDYGDGDQFDEAGVRIAGANNSSNRNDNAGGSGAGLNINLRNGGNNANAAGIAQQGAATYTFPPKNLQPFFASHFIMGGERFESPQPESFLFGDNADLNYLGRRPVAFPYPPPSATEPIKTLRSYMNIRRDSLHFKIVKEKEEKRESQTEKNRSESAPPEMTKSNESPTKSVQGVQSAILPGKKSPSGSISSETTPVVIPAHKRRYNVEFILDTDVRCAVTLYFFCVEEVTSQGVNYVSQRPELTSKTFEFSRGATHVFNQPEFIFNPEPYFDDLQNPDLIPIVIQCVALEGEGELGLGNGPLIRQSHITMGTIEKYANEAAGYGIKSIKQKLFVDGLCYLVQEVYGLENKNSNSEEADKDGGGGSPGDGEEPDEQQNDDGYSDDDLDDCGAECVVCMCDLRDTIILPCRHLCLCNSCADSLRYQASNCPICRAPFRALLQIRAVQKVGQITHPSLPELPESNDADIPPGYLATSLVEALNGPTSAPKEFTTSALNNSVTVNEETVENLVSNELQELTETPDEGQSQDKTDAKVAALNEHKQKITVKFVDEIESSPTAAAASKENEDIVDEELAKLPAPQSLNAKEDQEEKTVSSIVQDIEVDEAVIVNVPLQATSRVSVPGTPTSLVSIRSSQESNGSSSSSTKQLLPTSKSLTSVSSPETQTTSGSRRVATAPADTSRRESQPNNTVVVRVHPMSSTQE